MELVILNLVACRLYAEANRHLPLIEQIKRADPTLVMFMDWNGPRYFRLWPR